MNVATEHYVVVERETLDTHADLPPYVLGPFADEASADEECQSDTGITFCLVTIDAKTEGYVVNDCYTTSTPPEGERITP